MKPFQEVLVFLDSHWTGLARSAQVWIAIGQVLDSWTASVHILDSWTATKFGLSLHAVHSGFKSFSTQKHPE